MGYLIAFLAPALLVALALGAAAGWELHRARTRGRIEALEKEREREMKRILSAGDPEAVDRAVAEERAQAQAVVDQLTHTQSRLVGSEEARARLMDELRQLRIDFQAAIKRAEDARTAAEARDQMLSQEVVRLREALGDAEGRAAPTTAPSTAPATAPAAPPPAPVLAPTNDLKARYLSARAAWLERFRARAKAAPDPAIPALNARIAELESRAAPEAIEEEATRLRWQNRYLAGRNRRLESLVLASASTTVSPPPPQPPQPPPTPAQTAEDDRRAFWRARYLEARNRHLEGALVRRAPGASDERLAALAAERDAAIAEVERLAAALAAAPAASAPASDFSAGLAGWTSQAAGAAEAASDPVGWSAVATSEGAVAEAAGGFRELRPRALLKLEPGRPYRMTVKVRQVRDAGNGGGQWAGIDAFPALDEAFAALPPDAAPKLQDLEGAPRAAALVAGQEWTTLSALIVSHDARARWARPRVYVNWRGDRTTVGDGAAQIAAFTVEDLSAPAPAPDRSARLREAWRARAARRVRREPLRDAPIPTPPAPKPAPQAAEAPAAPAPAATAPAASAPITAPPPKPRRIPERLPAPRDGLPDDLQRVAGVDPRLERALNDAGIFHYDQIATWTPENVAWIDRHLSLKGRVEAQAWVDQARRLAGLDGARV